MPKRLIDVGASQEHDLMIRSSVSLPADVEYVCLSHRWGELVVQPLYNPEQSWLKDDQYEAPAAAMPVTDVDVNPFKLSDRLVTFQHAVDVTRKLGKRYLWLDMLCIVQNDTEEWQEESAKMGTIYAGASVTLVADGAQDASQGLFHARDAASINPIVVKDVWNNDSEECYFVIISADFWREYVAESMTGQRAWCLQERYLAPAKLHFGTGQLAWECRSKDYCETFPQGLRQLLQSMHGVRFADRSSAGAQRLRKLSTRADDITEDEEPELDQYYLWCQLVERYARTTITHDGDRLAAIHGLAVSFSTTLSDTYIAGLWFNILPAQLLWSIGDGARATIINAMDDPRDVSPWQPQGRRPPECSAPSWSWASVIGPLIMPKPQAQHTLVDVQIWPPEDGEAGLESISFHHRAILVATGVLHKGFIAWHSRHSRWNIAMNPIGFCSSRLFTDLERYDTTVHQHHLELTDSEEAQRGAEFPSPVDDSTFILGAANPDTDSSVIDPERMQFAPVYCLPVIDTKKRGKHATQNVISSQLEGISGLILGTSNKATGISGMYMLLGVFHLFNNDETQLSACYGDERQDDLFMAEDSNRSILLM